MPCCPDGFCSRCNLNRKVRKGHARPAGARPRAARTAPLPVEPTSAWPGSEEKIRILTERARRGEQLFHPEDDGGG